MKRRDFLAASGLFIAAPALAQEAGGPESGETVRMRDLYNKDLSFSDYARAKAGERIAVAGFMAPPLKAEASFFVLTKRPLAVCPFCETEAEWPDDILAVHTKRVLEVVPFNVRIVTRGRLELGSHKDPETGFLSRVRLVDSSYARA